MYNTKNIHTHNGAIPDTATILHNSNNEEFPGCGNVNSGNTPTSVKPVQPKQSTTSVLRQWRRPDTVDSGHKHVPTKYTKDQPGYPAAPDNPVEYSMYSQQQQQHSTAVPAQYLSRVQYGGDSAGYNRVSPVQPPKQDARVPDSVVKYGTAGQYYTPQESTGEVHYRGGGSYPGPSTPPLAHSASAKVTPSYANADYASGNQKLSPNYHYPMVAQNYHHQKIQQHDSKTISDEQNAYCLKSGAYPAQNRVAQPNGHPNVAYSLQNQLDRRHSPQESGQPYYVNKSACLTQELRHGRQPYVVDKVGGYAQAYGQSYLTQKPNLLSPQEQKSREYRQIVQSPTKKSPPFPILEQRLSAEGGSFYPEYGGGAYAHHKYGAVMVPGAAQKNYLNTSGPKFPPEDVLPSTYAKYYSQNKVTYEPNHYLLQMNQMQTRLNPNLFSRATELPRDVAYMDQTPRGHPKRCIQYNAIEASQYGAKPSNIGVQKPAKIVTYSSVQDQRLAEHPSGEYFRNYSKPQSVIQSSKMLMDSFMPGRSDAVHEPQSYAYSPPLIHQNTRPTLAQYPTNYRPNAKTNEVSSGNISPRRTFQENMPVVVIPPQCIGLPKMSPPQYSLPGQEYPQIYQNYLPKESYPYPGSNVKPGNVQYRNDQLVKQPVHVSRNIQVQAPRVLPAYPGAQYQQSSPDGPEKIYYPARSIYGQQVVQPANPSYSGVYNGPDYRGYEKASVVRSPYAKKEVDIGKSLKEYLESWEDDEDIVTNLPDVVLCNNIPAEKQKHVSFAEPIAEAKSISSAEKLSEDESASQPLYILDSTNISSEALSQYLHIQQIDHLPANIKGYYKIPGVAAPAEPLEKPSRPAADQKCQNSKEQELKAAEIKAALHTRQLEELARVAEKVDSPVGKPGTQVVTVEHVESNHTDVVHAQDYSKTRELNILEATELRIPEISAELAAETAAENTAPQDYSVNKRGGAEMAEPPDAARFQNCLPQDFSITRKTDAEIIFQEAEKLSAAAEDTVEAIPQDYSINKPTDRLLLAETGQLPAPENTTEASVIHPNTPEDYSESLQEDVALNLSTNRSKFEDNSEDSHLLREILREADSSIIEESTKTMCAASKLQAVLQGSNEERDEDKVSSSNTRNLQPAVYANRFSSKLNEDASSWVEAPARIEEYMEIQHDDLQKSDSKFDVTKPPAVVQIHTASVIVQNTFFDDKSSSKTISEPLKQQSVPSSTPQMVQMSHQELDIDRSSLESGSPSLQAGESSITLRSDCQKQLTNRIGINEDGHNDEKVAEVCSGNIISIAEDDPSTYSCLEPSEMSPVSSDTPKPVPTATLQYNSQSLESFSADNSCYEPFELSDFEKQVKHGRKKSLLDDYKQKKEENSSGQSSSECSEDEDDYTRQRTEIEDASSELKGGTSDSEDRELFTSDNSDEEDREFDKERAEDSSTEDVTTEGTTEVSTSKYSKIMRSANEETTEEELYQSSKEEQDIQSGSGPGTPDDQGTIGQDETSQSTTTEEDTDDPAKSTTEVKSTSGHDESSQSTIEEECSLEESNTSINEKEQSTIRIEELVDNIQQSTIPLDELRGSRTGEDGTIPGRTTDEETTIIQNEESEEAKEIATTEPVLHQSTDEVVQDKENTSTLHDQAVLEDASIEENLKQKVEENRPNNPALYREIDNKNTGLNEDCKDLACSNNSPETRQQPSQHNSSNNASASIQEHSVCQCKKLATCNNCQANVQEVAAASQQCNKVATGNNSRETAGENSGQYVVLNQQCKAKAIIEQNKSSFDNQEDTSSIDNHVMLCSSQCCSEDGQSECEDTKDCNELEQSEHTVLQCEDFCLLGNSTDKSEDCNPRTDTEEYEDASFPYVAKDIRRSTGEDSGTTLQFEDADLQFDDTDLQVEETQFNSVLYSEDEDTLRSLEELRDVSLQSEDADLQSEHPTLRTEDSTSRTEDTVLLSEDPTFQSEDALPQTDTIEAEVILEDLSEEVSLPAEENVPVLKKHMSFMYNKDNSCDANKSALSDHSTLSSKREDFLIERLISIDGDTSNSQQLQETIPTDSFEREMENIFKNIPKDPVVPETYPSISETSSTTENHIQPETAARSTDNLKPPESKLQTLNDTELQLETNSSKRMERVSNIADTSRESSTSFEETFSQDDLSSRDLDEELCVTDDEIPEDLVEASMATVPEVASPGDVVCAGECLVIYSAADDFVILQEPETVSAEAIVQEEDTEELTGEHLNIASEAMDEQRPQAESEEHVQDLVASQMSTADEDEQLVVPPKQVIDSVRADPLDEELNKHLVKVDDKQEMAKNPTKLNESQEPAENQNEIPVNDSVKCEDSLHLRAEPTYQEIQVQMTTDEVKAEQVDVELQLVSEIEVTEHCLQDVKHEIEEELPTEQRREMEDVGTIEEFKIDVKEEIVNLESCAEEVQVKDEKVKELNENVDFKEEVLDYKKNADQFMKKEDDVGAAMKDEKPEALVKEDLLATDTVSDEKLDVELKIEDNASQKNDKVGNIREELEEGELSDQSETKEAQEVKTDVMVIDDWDEPEGLLGCVQLQVPISQEKKLLFARRKKNLEKLKAKLLAAKQTQLDSMTPSLSQIHTSAGKSTEELIQPSTAQNKPLKTTFLGVSPEVHSPEILKPESNKNKSRRDPSGSNSVKLGQYTKYSANRSSINSAPSLPDVDEDSSTNRTINPKLFPNSETTATNTKGSSKSSNAEDGSMEIVQFSLSSKASSSSQESSKSSSSTALGRSQCTPTETASKSTVASAPKDTFQLPPVLKRFRASVEDKELFINPENPQYQPAGDRSFDSSASRKRSQSYTDYSSLKIEFTAPKRRYSEMEIARPVRRPIINLDEISQNISQVLQRLDSTEKQRKVTYKQRSESKETSESVERPRNEIVTESQSKEKLVDQEWKQQHVKVHGNDKHTNIVYVPKPSEQKQAHQKLDQFKLFEKMAQRKSLKVLPAKLYEGEECVLNEINDRKVALSVSESPEELDNSMDNDQRSGANKFPTPSLREDYKITSTSVQHKATTSVQVLKALGQVDSAHHMSKPQQSKADPVESPEGIASSHQLGDRGRNDPLADVPSTLVHPILVLPKVSYNPRTNKICGVKNGQAKQNEKLVDSTKLCKNASESEKSTERRPGNAASKENSQKKLNDGQTQLEENKEGKSNVPPTQEDNETVKHQIQMTASQEQSQPKMLGNKEEHQLKHKGRNEDSQDKIKGNEDRQKVETSNRDNQKVTASKEDSQRPRVTDEDCPNNVERREEETKIQGRKEDGQLELERREEENQNIETDEHIQTKKNTSSICEGAASSLQCDKNKSDIVRSGDNMVRDTVLKSSTSSFNVDTSTAKSSTTVGKKISSILDTSPPKQTVSSDFLANSSSNEALLSNVHSNTPTVSSNVSTSNIKIEQPKLQVASSNDKRHPQERQRTSGNVKSSMVNMKSGKLNAIIAKLGSANLQAYTTAQKAANVIASSASESLSSDRSFEPTKGKEDSISSVNQRNSSLDQQDPLAGSKAASVGQLGAPEGRASTGVCAKVDRQSATVNQSAATVGQLIPPGHQIATAKGNKLPLMDQHPNTVTQACSPNVIGSPKITNTTAGTPVQCSTAPKVYTRPIVSPLLRNISHVGSSTSRSSSKGQAVSGKFDTVPPSSTAICNTSSSNTASVSVIVEPAAAKRKVIHPRSDATQTDVKKSEGIENKLANTFRLTEYTKSYIKLKMSQEMDTSIANGLKQSGPGLDQKPVKHCSQQLKRKLPDTETDTTVTAGLDKRVKINLQDYRNRKQLPACPSETKIDTGHPQNSTDNCSSSFDDCLGEVVNGIDDFMTVIEANKQYSSANEIGSESLCLDLTRRSNNLGIEMTGLEIYMDDSMELIPGNEEIVHTSKEEDLRENSGTEELDTGSESNSSQDRIKTNPTHYPPAGARKMRIRMLCKPNSAIDQARFEDVPYPGPSKVVQEEGDDRLRNETIPLPKTAMVKLTKETIPTNTNHLEPNVTNPLTRRRMKSKGEMKMYRPKRRKKRFRNLYTTDEDEESEVPTVSTRNDREMLPTDLTAVQLKTTRVRPNEETVASSEAIQDNSLPSCASPEDYSHLVSVEPASYKYRPGSRKHHLLRVEESQETNSSSSSGPVDDLVQLSRRQGYQHRPHKRGKSRDGDDDSLPDSSEALGRKLEYKCHINLNALGNKCNMLTSDPVQPSTSKMGLKLTLKSVRKEKPAFSEVLGCLDTAPTTGTTSCRRSKHGKRKVPRREHSSAYSVSTSTTNRGWTVNDKVPKVIIKRHGTGYCAVSRDVSTNPIWQPVIRVRRHRYIESLVRQGNQDSVP